MTTKKLNKDKKLIFGCDCGHPGYLEFNKEAEDGGCVWVSIVDEPNSFFAWFKQWFYRKVYYSEVLLSKNDVRRLVKFLQTGGKKKK